MTRHSLGTKGVAVKPLLFLLLISLCTSGLCAQRSKKQPPPPKQLSQTEKQWCPVIESARGGTADLQSAMRSFVLDMIAGGLKKCDPRQVRKVLIDAFTTTLAIPETEDDFDQQARTHDLPVQTIRVSMVNLEAKTDLQTDALRHLLTEDEKKVESLLPQAEPSVRDDLLNEMIDRALTAKKLNLALDRLRQVSPKAFPYGAATNLMFELPPTQDVEKQEIFQLAMAADLDQHSFVIGGDDFASMIVRFWKHLAPAVVLEAIHQVLDGARSNTSQIGLGAGSAKASFSNEYDYRAFELLPVLTELDEDEADKILADSHAAQAQLKEFPNGIQSLNPAIRDTPPEKGENPGLGGMVGRGIGPMLREKNLSEAYDSRIAEIARMAESNPKQAIAATTSLPNSSGSLAPRAKALLRIAQVTMTNNPLSARDALEEMSESLMDVEPTGHACPGDYWAEGIEIAMKISEIDLAKKLLKGGISQVEKLKSKDTDSDDPNVALKAWWPSTAAFSRLMTAASKISLGTALEAIGEVSDAEMRLLCRVRLANEQLGARTGLSRVMRSTTKSNWAEYGGTDE